MNAGTSRRSDIHTLSLIHVSVDHIAPATRPSASPPSQPCVPNPPRAVCPVEATRMSGTALDNWKSNPEEDHGPLMSGCIWGLWTISTLFVCLRVHVRLRHARIWWDDAVLLLGWVRNFVLHAQREKPTTDMPYSGRLPSLSSAS